MSEPATQDTDAAAEAGTAETAPALIADQETETQAVDTEPQQTEDREEEKSEMAQNTADDEANNDHEMQSHEAANGTSADAITSDNENEVAGDEPSVEDDDDDEEFEDEHDDVDDAAVLEDDDVDAKDAEWFDADHPLLSRMQEALKKRLTRQLDRVNIAHIEKEEDLARLSKEREDIGVELYHRQQELASEQLKLESVQGRYGDVKLERLASENGLDALKKQQLDLSAHQKQQSKKLLESRAELDALNQSLRRMKAYEASMKKEILNQRRSAYSSEEMMQELESTKIEQDLLINHLETKIASFRAQIEVYAVQLKVQEEETLSAREILRESLSEMELIASEKREYLGKWKSSLIELNKRDDILKDIEGVVADVREQARLKKIELAQYDKDIIAEQQQMDALQRVADTHAAEQAAMEKKMAAQLQQREELEAKLAALAAALSGNEEDLGAHKMEQKDLDTNLKAMEKKMVELMGEVHAVEDAIAENYSERMTLQHGSENVLSEIRKLSKKVHAKEFAVESLKNELAKLRFDEINAKQRLCDLDAEHGEAKTVLAHHSDIIEEYEKEFKKGIDELGKKTNVLDRLNNKLESLVRGAGGGNNASGNGDDVVASPLEHQIHHLSKELKESRAECDRLQKKWIVKQTELVNLVNETMAEEEVATNLGCKETILRQKRIRLHAHVSALGVDIKNINKAISGLRLDITKLNRHIADYKTKEATIGAEHERLETKYKIDLEVAAERTVELKSKIEAINAEKAELSARIVECERHILLWERKIKLEAETQKTLDPNYGKKELEDMRREIHRMDIRLGQLKRKQDDIIKEMELSINKKEMIELRNLGKAGGAGERNAARLINKKQMATLKANIKASLKEKKLIARDIEVYDAEHAQSLHKLAALTQRVDELTATKAALRQSILEKSVLQKVFLNEIVSKQKLAKEIKKSAKKSAKQKSAADEERIQRKLASKREKVEDLKVKVQALAQQHPQYGSLFNLVTNHDLLQPTASDGDGDDGTEQ